MEIFKHHDIVRCRHPYSKKEEYGLIIKEMDTFILFVDGPVGSKYWKIDNYIKRYIDKRVGTYEDSPNYWSVVLGREF